MNVLIYRYGSICEPDIIEAFRKMQLDVIEETAEITNKKISGAERVDLVRKALDEHKPLFVFSINFFPTIADICHIYGIKYLCWTVDCPVLELFSKSIQHDTNRIFLFDRAQYELYYPYNPKGIFYLPLAAATERFDKVIADITDVDKRKYSSDISFVGSLYIEKNPLRQLETLPEYVSGYIRGIVESSIKVMGYNFMEEILTDEIVEVIKKTDKNFYAPENVIMEPSRFVTAHSYVGMQAAETERIRTLNSLAQHFNVNLYTRSDTWMISVIQQYLVQYLRILLNV